MEQQLWFKRKYFGWGWRPVTWQGWGILALYLAGVFSEIQPTIYPLRFVARIVVLTVFLIIICWIKGERPRWQWGNTATVDETKQIQ